MIQSQTHGIQHLKMRTSNGHERANWGQRARLGAQKSAPYLTYPPPCLVSTRLKGAPIIRQILRVVIVSFAASYLCSSVVHCSRYRSSHIVSLPANYLGLTRSASPPPTLTPEGNSVGQGSGGVTTGACNCRWPVLWCVHPTHLLLLLRNQIGCTCNLSEDPRIVFTSPPPLFLRQGASAYPCWITPAPAYIEVIYHHLSHHIPMLFLSPRLFAGVTTTLPPPTIILKPPLSSYISLSEAWHLLAPLLVDCNLSNLVFLKPFVILGGQGGQYWWALPGNSSELQLIVCEDQT